MTTLARYRPRRRWSIADTVALLGEIIVGAALCLIVAAPLYVPAPSLDLTPSTSGRAA